MTYVEASFVTTPYAALERILRMGDITEVLVIPANLEPRCGMAVTSRELEVTERSSRVTFDGLCGQVCKSS